MRVGSDSGFEWEKGRNLTQRECHSSGTEMIVLFLVQCINH